MTEPRPHRSSFNAGRPVLTLLLFVLGVVYGLHFIANKWAFDAGVPIFAYVFWYCLCAGLVLLAGCAWFRELPTLRFSHWRVYLVMGCFGIAAPLALLTWLSSKLPVGVIGLVVVIAAYCHLPVRIGAAARPLPPDQRGGHRRGPVRGFAGDCAPKRACPSPAWPAGFCSPCWRR